MAYRNQQRQYHQPDDPLIEAAWKVGVVGLAIAFALVAMPSIIIAFFGQRYTAKRFVWGYKVWLLLVLLSMYPLWLLWQHGWPTLIARELFDFYHNAQLHQTDLAHWPLRALWPEVWPIWLRSLLLTPAIAVMIEGSQQVSQQVFLRQRRQAQERRADRARRKARRRTSKPAMIADAIENQMVMGVLIRDDEQEDN